MLLAILMPLTISEWNLLTRSLSIPPYFFGAFLRGDGELIVSAYSTVLFVFLRNPILGFSSFLERLNPPSGITFLGEEKF